MGPDVLLASDLGMERATDDEQLLVAANLNRILVTCDRKDFILLHDAWHRWSAAWNVVAHHAGILVIPDLWTRERATVELHAYVETRSFIDELHDHTKL